MAKRIGDVARAAGVGVETVRFYEREGLIDRPLKPQRGWREYDDAALAQLGQVRLARQWGLTLGDMKRMKGRAKGPRAKFCADVRDTVSARLGAIEVQIAELQAKRAKLKLWLRQCKGRRDAADCPLYAQIHSLMTQKPTVRKRT